MITVTGLRRLAKQGSVAGVLVAGCMLLVMTLVRKRSRGLFALAGLLVLCGTALQFGSHRPQANPLRVTFLDMGKGDAIVIETPGGGTIVVSRRLSNDEVLGEVPSPLHSDNFIWLSQSPFVRIKQARHVACCHWFLAANGVRPDMRQIRFQRADPHRVIREGPPLTDNQVDS